MNRKLLFMISLMVGVLGATLLASCEGTNTGLVKSDVALIYEYINTQGHLEPPEHDAYLIATRFRKWPAQTDDLNFQARRGRLQERMGHQLALLKDTPGAADCLAAPNTSGELHALQQQVAQVPKRLGVGILTFSTSCLAKDGKRYYYVERVDKGSPGADAHVYVVHQGVVEREILIWTT